MKIKKGLRFFKGASAFLNSLKGNKNCKKIIGNPCSTQGCHSLSQKIFPEFPKLP